MTTKEGEQCFKVKLINMTKLKFNRDKLKNCLEMNKQNGCVILLLSPFQLEKVRKGRNENNLTKVKLINMTQLKLNRDII